VGVEGRCLHSPAASGLQSMRQMHKIRSHLRSLRLWQDFRENPRLFLHLGKTRQSTMAETKKNKPEAIRAVAGTVMIQAATMRSTVERLTNSFL
jgi:hypothetical protein